MSDDRVCVGAIIGAFGVKGEVRLKSFCADPGSIASYGPVATEDGSRKLTMHLTQPVKSGFVARIDGVRSKEDADAMRGMRLYLDRAALPDLPDDEFYHADLIGLEVYDTGGALLGRIKAVLNHGATDLLEVTAPDLKDTVLLPFTQDAVPTVDLAKGRLIADPPEGLFPEP